MWVGGTTPGGSAPTGRARWYGVYVAAGVGGDYLCARYGDLQNYPLSVEIADSRIVDVRCTRQDLVDDFLAYTATDENSNRVGEFAMGTNIAVHDATGNILPDEKPPTPPTAPGPPEPEPNGAKGRAAPHRRANGRQQTRRRPTTCAAQY